MLNLAQQPRFVYLPLTEHRPITASPDPPISYHFLHFFTQPCVLGGVQYLLSFYFALSYFLHFATTQSLQHHIPCFR